MKICLDCNYIAPARDSMGAERVVEYLAKGLIELNNTVCLRLHNDNEINPVDGAILLKQTDKIPNDVDIIHFNGWSPDEYSSHNKPWVTTIHGANLHQQQNHESKKNIIAVSDFAAQMLGVSAYVHTCVDPSKFIFSDKKENYFLWMAGTDWGEGKGLFTTIRMAKTLRFNLKIAGSGRNQDNIFAIKKMCDDKIEYLGSINGQQKAEVLSKAKALILLTKLPDACPATISESMISGTPVIGSCNGSVPELINYKTGILVSTDAEFAKATMAINKIKPNDCKDYALQNYSYIECAKKYLKYYEDMIKCGTLKC